MMIYGFFFFKKIIISQENIKMKKAGISTKTIKFIKDITKNNNRDWFAENKERYLEAKADVEAFGDALVAEMQKHDNIEKIKVYRIYRDVRFSKDKTPYKDFMSAYVERATKWLRGGYYFHLQPGHYFVGGGFWSPNKEDLARIRYELAADPDRFRKILNAKKFKEHFGTLQGDQLKTAPKGYDRDHPAIDLLRYKQFLVSEPFTEKEVTSPEFLGRVVKNFKAMRPFFDFMSDTLTTDSNGEPLWDS